MPYATKSQIERARQPDLLTFLRRYKPDELIPTGPNAYKLRSHDCQDRRQRRGSAHSP